MKNLKEMNSVELKEIAKKEGIKNWWTMKKDELVEALSTTAVTELQPETESQPETQPEATDFFYLKDLAANWGLTEKATRRKLRNSGIERGEGVWKFTPKEFQSLLTNFIIEKPKAEKEPKPKKEKKAKKVQEEEPYYFK